jgi:hypothetical protein
MYSTHLVGKGTIKRNFRHPPPSSTVQLAHFKQPGLWAFNYQIGWDDKYEYPLVHVWHAWSFFKEPDEPRFDAVVRTDRKLEDKEFVTEEERIKRFVIGRHRYVEDTMLDVRRPICEFDRLVRLDVNLNWLG